ncbi:hypothetical protein [Labilibacter marinus]|uniref:hypothetical protein n=1 Tax=Labilibacter marinus TaxID=1477105 RepID=UPI00094FCFD4|nr:hypothetical protein [Labilibacter marinus]
MRFIKNIPKLLLIIGIIVLSACGTSKDISNSDSTVNRDGSSFKKAIIVNDIKSEYSYVRSVCEGCQILGQSLVFDKKKPYDVIKVQKSDGEKGAYYFDISSFYGKGF